MTLRFEIKKLRFFLFVHWKSQSTGSSFPIPSDLENEMKNPLGLNQAEVIAGLALELLKSSKRLINPITKQHFLIKFGRKEKDELFILIQLIISRFSFWSSSWWNCWSEEFSILFIWWCSEYGKWKKNASVSMKLKSLFWKCYIFILVLGESHYYVGGGKDKIY